MKEKGTYELRECVKDYIKKDDLVRLIDGSGFTPFSADEYREDLYIVLPYPKITKSELQLKELAFKVLETKVKTNVCVGYRSAYIQDIIIEFNGVKFRTCSAFVEKL